jgi:hypothetical protein
MTFSILDHIDKLEPSPKKKGKFICPACKDDNFGIASKGDPPAFSCFGSGCDSKDIINALAPLPQQDGKSHYKPRSKKKPSARERERAVQLDSARIEAKVEDLLRMVSGDYHSLEQAQIELGNWAKAEGYSAFDAGQLFKAQAKELGLAGDKVSGLTTAELVARIESWEAAEDATEKWEFWEALKRDSGKTHRDLMALVSARKIKPPPVDDDWAISAKAFGALDLGAKEWLFEGLLPANRSILLGADAKTGKSLVVYDWAYSLATGQGWGEFPCDRPRKVLIVQTDESEIDCQERLAARGLTELDNVRVIREFTPALMPRLKRVVANWGAEVVIFDSLTSIQRHSGYSPNDPEYAYFLYDIKEWASAARVTPMIVCHTNKASVDLGIDKIAGTKVIPAAVSEILMLTRPADPADDCDRVLVRVGSRSSGQSAWLIGLNLEDYSWEYKFPCQRDGRPLEDDTSFTPDEKLNCRETIVQFLAHHNGRGFEAKEISEIISCSYNNVRKILADLRSEGIILRRKSGRAWVYSCRLPVEPPANSPPDGEVIHPVFDGSEPSTPTGTGSQSSTEIGNPEILGNQSFPALGSQPDPQDNTGSEKNSQKSDPVDHYTPLRHTESGFQVDHLSDPFVIRGSRQPDPSDPPVQDLTDEELAELLGGGGDG